jgi:hypothetical protein
VGALDKDAIARMLGIPPDEQKALDAGSNHPYRCRCEKCRQWWKLMGADENGKYGPFAREEIEN